MIDIQDITKVYRMGEMEVRALNGVSLHVGPGEWVAMIMGIFRSLHAQGMTIVMVTHDPEIAAQCERVVCIKDGLIASDELNATLRETPIAVTLPVPHMHEVPL